ncbi:biotin/lipoyl-containing protein, partial [Paenibacillus sp. AR247]|uniref:biotin/lipoyl-containing protein n=1 Tax=Paenibacillus sp. AR247 TaxID=1631599 RepID=UPI000D433E7B
MSDITVPAMGESITEGTIFKWHVEEGQAVSQGDVLLELETDKVNLEISAEEDGVVEKILRKDGDTVQIGEVIGRMGTGGDAKPASASAAKEEAPQAQQPSAPAAAPAQPAAPAAAEPARSGDGEGYLAASPAARK